MDWLSTALLKTELTPCIDLNAFKFRDIAFSSTKYVYIHGRFYHIPPNKMVLIGSQGNAPASSSAAHPPGGPNFERNLNRPL
jgi:hypothetical protein